jgi:hypothetical protein
MATRWERGGPLVPGKSAFVGGGQIRASRCGTTTVVACRNQREGAVNRRTAGKPKWNGEPGGTSSLRLVFDFSLRHGSYDCWASDHGHKR